MKMEENLMFQYIGEIWSTILFGMKMQDAGKPLQSDRGSRNIYSDYVLYWRLFFSVKKAPCKSAVQNTNQNVFVAVMI